MRKLGSKIGFHKYILASNDFRNFLLTFIVDNFSKNYFLYFFNIFKSFLNFSNFLGFF